MNPPLIEQITFCDTKGFDVQPVREGKQFRFIIWKGESILKIGKKQYKCWHTGQKEVYDKLYTALTTN